eukprot:scaffold51163_cov29-Tisochrysis_lutea.AAC.3
MGSAHPAPAELSNIAVLEVTRGKSGDAPRSRSIRLTTRRQPTMWSKRRSGLVSCVDGKPTREAMAAAEAEHGSRRSN